MTTLELENDCQSPPKAALVSNNGHVPSTKRKRDVYTPTACNECKRRKIKCNGRTPCERCSRQLLDCRYRSNNTSEDHPNVDQLLKQINALQNQVSVLSDHVAAQDQSMRIQAPPVHEEVTLEDVPGHVPGIQPDPCTSFEGPTTSAFKIKIARDALKRDSLVEDSDDGGITREASPSPLNRQRNFDSIIDPMWTISHQEATRLYHVYEEEMGIMYPIVPVEQISRHINILYSRSGDLFGSRIDNSNPGNRARLSLEDVIILKLMFACALTAEENGHSNLGLKLFQSTRDVVNDSVWSSPSIMRITALALTSILFFQIDEEHKAWRTIGIAIRMCLEMGLHQREILVGRKLENSQREQKVRLFWSIYVLDNRWSIGTGLPSHLAVGDIDPTLPRPEGVPYLTLMIEYSHLSAKVWKHVSSSPCSGIANKKNEVEYIHWQILQWAESIPDHLKLPEKQSSTHWSTTAPPTRAIQRLQCLLYLRTNLMRMLVYQPALLSASAISQNTSEADMIVEIAKETIQFIFHLNETSNIYQLQQVAFNFFLVSALAVLLLAIAHAPARYGSQCKVEFYLALELVKKFSMKSYVSKRLWKSIKGLQRYVPKKEVHQNQPVQPNLVNDNKNADPSVYHQLQPPETSQLSLNPTPENLYGAAESEPSGRQMTLDFMNLFEFSNPPSYGATYPELLDSEEWGSNQSDQLGYEALLFSTLNSCFGPSISLV